jgi:hypothetical protein
MFWEHKTNGSRIYISGGGGSNFMASTGGSFVTAGLIHFHAAMEYFIIYNVMVEFRDNGRTDDFSTWWLKTPVLDTLVTEDMPEL